jgi:hypothetical protein
MERVSRHEETALNPDPFDLVESDFAARAVVRVGTMRPGADAAPAVPMSVPVRPAQSGRGDLRPGPDAGCVDTGAQAGFQILKGLRPSRAEGIAGFARSAAGVSPSFAPEVRELQDGSLEPP